MPLSLRRGVVTAVLERRGRLLRIEVDGVACTAYPQLTGEVEPGDDVLVNEQARRLDLGSGGFDVLYANLTRGLGLDPEEGAHVMKLPYSPVQLAVRHGEEDRPLADALDGLPVVACSLHSQVAPVCAALAGLRVAYVQLPGGALPLALSDTTALLRDRGLLEVTVGVGACFGGNVDCVSSYSALALAKAAGVDVIVGGIGPGIVGTGTALGHGGLAAAEIANATAALGGRAIVAARVSRAETRERHRGLSHHTRAVLELCLGEATLAWPEGLNGAPPGAKEIDVSEWREACAGLPLSHMGRGPDEDPWFFAAAFGAGVLARRSAE